MPSSSSYRRRIISKSMVTEESIQRLWWPGDSFVWPNGLRMVFCGVLWPNLFGIFTFQILNILIFNSYKSIQRGGILRNFKH